MLLNADARNEWRAHWVVVATAMAGMATSQIHLFSFGLMIAPLQQEFGWDRAEIASGLFIKSMIGFLLAPFVGMMIDRLGPRRIAIFGKALYCVALICFALVTKSLWTWWLIWTFLSLGISLHSSTVWVTTVTSLFSASRGLALAVTLTASGIGAFAIPLVTYLWIEDFGWRGAFVLWGVVTAIVMLPCLYLFFYSAMDKDRMAAKSTGRRPVEDGVGISVREALRSKEIYQMCFVGFVMSFIGVALSINIVPILNTFGMDRATAATIAGLFGLSQIGGRLACGHFLDRFDARHVGATVVVIPIVAFLMIIAFGSSQYLAAAAVLLAGLAVGAEIDVLGYLGSRLFGGRNFGTLFGIMMSLTAVGSGLGPVVAGYVFDATGSYNLFLWGIIPLSFACGLSLLTLRAYPSISIKDAPAIAA